MAACNEKSQGPREVTMREGVTLERDMKKKKISHTSRVKNELYYYAAASISYIQKRKLDEYMVWLIMRVV